MTKARSEATAHQRDHEDVSFEKVKHDWLRIRQLQPHPEVQRPLNLCWVKKLRDGLDPDQFGELWTIPRDDHFLVFNGQHRLLAARELWGEHEKVPCTIFYDLTTERLAELFLGCNTALKMRAIDKWKVRLLAHDDIAVAVEAILRRHELRTGDDTQPGVVRAVTALETVYTNCGGAAALTRTLGILRGAWDRDPVAFDAVLLRGLGVFVHHFNGELKDEDLTRRLRDATGPARMLGEIRDFAKVTSTTTTRAVCHKLLTLYNKGRRPEAKLHLGDA